MKTQTLVMGTAGHIDHGKTALVKALTGVDTDRLKEEKERGITTELGFTHLTLPSGTNIGVVDVPGHEKFVRHMVAGASGLDFVLLIVAADEGVMPQTIEHVQICRLLGIKKGLIAITKKDLVDDEMIELVKEDIADLVKDTFLENAPMFPVSSLTGEGIPALVEAIDQLIQEIHGRETDQIFRLPIDRVFTMKGFGTVVTGTLISGELKTGDEIEILPSQRRCKVRGIQVHNQPTDVSKAGQRTAVNLQGVEKRDIQRGEVLIHPGSITPTHRLDAYLTMLPTAEHPVTHASIHRFHIGTSLHLAKIYLLDKEILEPSQEGFVQFVFEDPVIALPKDRFVIRGSGKIQTLGGGEVLFIHSPRRKRNAKESLETLRLLKEGSEREKVLFFVQASGLKGITFSKLLESTNMPRHELETILEEEEKQGTLARLALTPPVYLHKKQIATLSQQIAQSLEAFHAANPLKEGMEKEVLRSQLVPDMDKKFWDHLLNLLCEKGPFEVQQDTLRSTQHTQNIDPAFQKAIEEVRRQLRKGGPHPPTLKELTSHLKRPAAEIKTILNFLQKEGECVKLTEEIYMDIGAFEKIKNDTIIFLNENGEITVQSFKELTGLSRKFAVPILELFDKLRITLRIDQKRVLRS